ncbi:MAG TPA: glycosyltransferase family 4 protein [Solirubrobacteraceae bacterium]|nr:glycosyltransferase family 4 protein [Solirubrobacteraceae bacterium]
MPGGSLHIAWLGAGPRPKETGGVPGVATDLLQGLATQGHRVEALFGGWEHELPAPVADQENLTFFWSGTNWRWGAWYNRNRISMFVSGLVARGLASLRLRREVARRHRADPFDVVYQFGFIETLALPASVRREVPLVIHPEVHMTGELRSMIAERELALRSDRAHTLVIAGSVMWLRSLVQRLSIRRANVVVCISRVFRQYLIDDYGVRPERTVVVPNPVRLRRFADLDLTRPLGDPPAILVLGRIAVRKGLEDVIALAELMLERGVQARIRIIGRASLWSNYLPLLADLPENAEYLDPLPAGEVPGELGRSDVLLQASKYEPFGLTVAEALAAGVTVVATTEVGAAEGVSGSVLTTVRPGDVEGMLAATEELITRLAESPAETRQAAHAEAERLFAPDLVCDQIVAALRRAVETFGR